VASPLLWHPSGYSSQRSRAADLPAALMLGNGFPERMRRARITRELLFVASHAAGIVGSGLHMVGLVVLAASPSLGTRMQ
jgi:hypothetical protein